MKNLAVDILYIALKQSGSSKSKSKLSTKHYGKSKKTISNIYSIPYYTQLDINVTKKKELTI